MTELLIPTQQPSQTYRGLPCVPVNAGCSGYCTTGCGALGAAAPRLPRGSRFPYDSLLSPTTLQLGRTFVIVIDIGGERDAPHLLLLHHLLLDQDARLQKEDIEIARASTTTTHVRSGMLACKKKTSKSRARRRRRRTSGAGRSPCVVDVAADQRSDAHGWVGSSDGRPGPHAGAPRRSPTVGWRGWVGGVPMRALPLCCPPRRGGRAGRRRRIRDGSAGVGGAGGGGGSAAADAPTARMRSSRPAPEERTRSTRRGGQRGQRGQLSSVARCSNQKQRQLRGEPQ
mmetsp:Transcript_15095/g.40514  ORF Transcript_15095/g.40514 Transcript_15095/m.40514 type:complete len:285 (+) Transcript_15095:561-1415(+)